MTAIEAAAPTQHRNLESIVRGEFNEMPGMRLTAAQACRLWSLGLEDGERLLNRLVAAGFLVRDHDSRYCRRHDRSER